MDIYTSIYIVNYPKCCSRFRRYTRKLTKMGRQILCAANYNDIKLLGRVSSTDILTQIAFATKNLLDNHSKFLSYYYFFEFDD